MTGLAIILGMLGASDTPGLALFEREIRPLLVEKCYGCHSDRAEELEAELRLDSREGWAEGGESGPAIVPGRPGESLLLRAVGYGDPDLRMPPEGKLSDREIRALERWIALGAPDPRTRSAGDAKERAAPEEEDLDLDARRAAHWAWKPLRRLAPPDVEDASWPRSAIDRFVLARLEEEGLSPAPPAARRAWIRRVTFDLTGLPPSPAEVEAFLADARPGARERVVDRLLSSPCFGEAWGQHWLDLVRYAETRGHESDFPIPHAWRYRDYVIRALNADVPYDRLVIEHVAGDLLEEPRIDPHLRTNESIQGTGFWHLGEATHSPVDIRGDEADRVANQIDVFSRAFLGLTVGCARCHDHKFDPITAEDYYALAGFLQSSSYIEADVSDPAAQEQVFEGLKELREASAPRILDALAEDIARRADRSGEYLLAAAEAIGTGAASPATAAAGANAGGGTAPPNAPPEPLPARVARGRGLDPAVLGRWVEELLEAREDLGHPLHPFVAIVSSGDAGEAAGIDATSSLAGVRRRWAEATERTRDALRTLEVVTTRRDGRDGRTTETRPFRAGDVVVDFASPGPEDWITSGYRFGDRPVEPGEIVPGGVAEEPAARSDHLSERLTGLLRTRTFEVTSDTLWYRFRGKADVFLAVDSHRVVHGPLHGVVRQKLEGDGDYRWHAHRVSDYIGHRVHVEFRPREGFALSRIVFAAEPPPEVFRPNGRIARFLEGLEGEDLSLEDLASRYGRLLAGVPRELSRAREAAASRDVSDLAALLDWLLDREDLLEPSAESGPLQAVLDEYEVRKRRLEAEIPAPVRALALLDGSAENEPVHVRGSHRTLSPDPVARRLPESIETLAGATRLPETGSGRLELARRMTDPRNPFLARVIANRIWHHLFGRGIARTVDDLGAMGEPPSHPDLLDWLATELVRADWSLKRLVRSIVLSSAYGMSSRPEARAEALDPENALIHRLRVRRLPAESIRDAILAISGRLDRRMGGPSVRVHITPFMRGNRSPSGSGPVDGDGRRSVYIEVRRNHLSHFLAAFDKPPPFSTVGRRLVSSSASQPLILLNDPLVHEEAGRWAKRLLAEEGSVEERLARAFLAAFARRPAPSEVEGALAFLEEQMRAYAGDRTLAWKDLCHTIMNMKEFIYLE